VLVPALTFVATANVVLYNGLKPVFVDVEPEYFCIDPSLVKARLTPRTRAVVPVHVAGLACDMDPILELAQAHGLCVVEDCAEAMTATYKGRPVGSFGDVACFSTYIAHVITTGVGGLCTTNDPELIELLKSRDSIYIRIDDDREAEGDALLEIVDRRFSFVRLGHSFRCTEMEAALGVAELEQLELAAARRTKVVARLLEGLTPLEARLRLPRPRPGAEHAYMFFPLVLLDPAVERHDLIAYLEEHGIETRYLLPLINQPVYRRIFGNLDAQYPVASWLNERAFYIGCQAGMSDEDVEYVISCLRTYFQGRA
jgi:dTDP-4-amino-4,6-dideoxygalactose transaminase